LIAGLVDPTAGRCGSRVRRYRGPGQRRSFVFQDFASSPGPITWRNVAFGLELRGMPKNERDPIAKKYIAQVGIGRF